MTDAVLVAVITGILTLAGTIITVVAGNRKVNEALKISQAVMDTKLDKLTEEVEKIGDLTRDIPVMKEQIKVINHRIDDLEKGR